MIENAAYEIIKEEGGDMICPKMGATWNVRVFTYRCHLLNHPSCEYNSLPIFLQDSDTLNWNVTFYNYNTTKIFQILYKFPI